MFAVPDQVTVVRPIVLGGELLPQGTNLTKAQVALFGKSLNAYLDSGIIVATPDPHARRLFNIPKPSSLPPVIRNAMVENIVENADPLKATAAVGKSGIEVTITGGVAPYRVMASYGAASNTSETSVVLSFPDRSGTYYLTVTDAKGTESETQVHYDVPTVEEDE